jgi:formate dehydrogenase major subunit
MSHWPFQPNWQHFSVDATHAYFVMDHNRCILCHRCVRACGQLVGNFTLGIEERGSSSMLVADTGVPLGDSTCVSCGTCVSVCPTGALIERRAAYQGHEKNLETTQTVCVGCSVGCGISAFARDNRLVRILGDWEAPVNGGVLCKTGRFLPIEEERQRVTTPMVKKDGKLHPVTWDEALDTIANTFQPLAGKNGSGVAAIASTRLPAEALALFKKIFADGLGSEMVTASEEGMTTALATSLAEELGKPFEANLDAVKKADCVMLIGVNLADTHMVTGFLFKRTLPNGTRLIIVDPNPNGMDLQAHVAIKATRGADLDVLKGIQAGLVKLGLVAGNGAEAEKALADAAQATGTSADDLLAAAGMLGTASSPVIIFGKGITTKGSLQTLRALHEVGTAANAGMLSIKGEANSLAAAQYRLMKPFALNGHQAVYAAIGDDSPSQRLVQRMEKAPFVVVQASYVSRLTSSADVVLPVEMWAEQEGHYLNLEGRIQESKRILTAPDGVRSNVDALKAVAEKLGLPVEADWYQAMCSSPSPVEIMAETAEK